MLGLEGVECDMSTLKKDADACVWTGTNQSAIFMCEMGTGCAKRLRLAFDRRCTPKPTLFEFAEYRPYIVEFLLVRFGLERRVSLGRIFSVECSDRTLQFSDGLGAMKMICK